MKIILLAFLLCAVTYVTCEDSTSPPETTTPSPERIKCYRCVELETPDSESFYIEDRGVITSNISFCKPHDTAELSADDLATCDAGVTECVKFSTQFSGDNNSTSFVVRGCLGDTLEGFGAVDLPTSEEACDKADGETIENLGLTKHCYLCDGNDETGCNSAVNTQISLLVVALAGIVGKFLL